MGDSKNKSYAQNAGFKDMRLASIFAYICKNVEMYYIQQAINLKIILDYFTCIKGSD